jgi:Tfp pilus assembly protein PilF
MGLNKFSGATQRSGMNVLEQHLQASMAAVRAGNKAHARKHLQQVLAHDPRNQTAWLWLSHVMSTPSKRCAASIIY